VPRDPKPNINRRFPRATPAREIALDVLRKVRYGRFAENALSDRLRRENMSPEDRGLATELVYGVLRWRDRLDAIIRRCMDRPNRKVQSDVREILRIALYQIVLLDRVPHWAAVDQAAVQTRSRCGDHAVGFVNAVLRNALRNLRAVDPEPDPEAYATYFSHPQWLTRRWLEEYGPELTFKILKWNNTPAPLDLRVNTLKTRVESVVEFFERQGIQVRLIPGLVDALRISSLTCYVADLDGYAQGWFTVQGSVSQMIAPLLRAVPGERILDACAAPGGKTAHLAALVGNRAQIIATDADARRIELTRKNLDRLGVQCAETLTGDVASPEFISRLGEFDHVLVDAPCSNLGVLRHNPEIRYRLGPEGPAECAAIQLRMLVATAAAVKPGGTLLYSVCTTTHEETRGVTQEFLRRAPEFSLEPIDPQEVPSSEFIDSSGFFTTFPPRGDEPLDGFFAARFLRRDAK
jgi:16S rRNA (cytosine967-C5)-methyltransferase